MNHFRILGMVLLGLFAVRGTGAARQLAPLAESGVEKLLLETIKGAAREGPLLKLQTDVGPVTFQDRIHAGEGSARYHLAGYRDARGFFYLVHILGYEGHGYALVSKTSGQVVHLHGVPRFSPDGKRFIDVSLDLDAGYMPNLIHIYGLDTNNKYVLEWKYVFEGRKGPSDPVWLNDSTLVFFEVTFSGVPDRSNLNKKPFVVERDNGTWNLPRALK